MKKFLLMLCIAFITISCNFNEVQPPAEYIDGTWSGVFKGYWHGMNNNYVFWNIDSPNGEWDRVYDKYLPKFDKLGEIDYQDEETTKEAIMLFMNMTKNLSDGHFSLLIPTVGGRNIQFDPRYYQIAKGHSKADDKELFETIYEDSSNIYYYLPDEMWYEYSYGILTNTFGVNTIAPDAIGTYLYVSESLKADEIFSEWQQLQLESNPDKLNLDDYFSEWILLVQDFNTASEFICLLGITKGSDSIPKDCIYFMFSSFRFYDAFKGDENKQDVLRKFFEYKADDRYVGLILDLRGNTGGYNYDRDILLSDLLSEPILFGYSRNKVGNNRLDYTPYIPAYSSPYPYDDELSKPSSLYDKPIVALVNRRSASNAEITSIVIQKFPKGMVIGGKTVGAYGSLQGNNTNANAGEFSVGDNISLVYTPYTQFVTTDYVSYEGKGLEPDIKVEFDREEFANGNDTRLQAAFDYVKENM